MKNALKLMLLFVMILMSGCAVTSPYMRKAEPITAKPSPDKALVYFMMPSSYTHHFQIWDRYKLIGLVLAKSYFAYECDPGEYLFIGRAENKRAVKADLEAGKTYYIITQVKVGAWRPRLAFIPVTRGSEYWDQVETYKKELNFFSPNEEEIAKWESRKKEEAHKELKEIIDYLGTPEGEKYISALNREDGR